MEQQNKESQEVKRKLDQKIDALKNKIDDVEAEIDFTTEKCDKNKEYMQFIDLLIKEFRPTAYAKMGSL